MSAKVLRRGQVCRLAMPDHSLDGAEVRLIRQSTRTGDWTTEILAARGAYRAGDHVAVPPHSLALVEARTIERTT